MFQGKQWPKHINRSHRQKLWLLPFGLAQFFFSWKQTYRSWIAKDSSSSLAVLPPISSHMLGNSDTLQSSCPSGICNTSCWYNFSFFLQYTLHWIMKESLIMSLCLKIWGVFRLVPMVLGSTTLHQDLNIFLPGELSHSLPVSTTGRWMWQAVATGPLDSVMTLGHKTVTWSLTQREFFYFFVSERTISAVALPPPH